MPSKTVIIPDIGTVTLTKRRSAKSIRLSIGADNSVRVSLPSWVPYQAGIAFISSKKSWVAEHRQSVVLLQEGDLVGKSHRIRFVIKNQPKITTRVSKADVTVTLPLSEKSNSKKAQDAAKKTAIRALKQESETLLPIRIRQLATKYGFTYKSLHVKRLKARWGSCSHQADITLNIFLMQLPWHLIDYVIVHELVHTKELNHSAQFWKIFDDCMPGAKKLRKELRAYHPYF